MAVSKEASKATLIVLSLIVYGIWYRSAAKVITKQIILRLCAPLLQHQEVLPICLMHGKEALISKRHHLSNKRSRVMDSRFTPTQAAHSAVPWPDRGRLSYAKGLNGNNILQPQLNSIHCARVQPKPARLLCLKALPMPPLKRWSAMPMNETGLTKPLIVLNIKKMAGASVLYSAHGPYTSDVTSQKTTTTLNKLLPTSYPKWTTGLRSSASTNLSVPREPPCLHKLQMRWTLIGNWISKQTRTFLHHPKTR